MKNLIKILPLFLILGACQNSDCTNGQQDGNETGIDCGGNCMPCNTNPTPTTCSDGIQNGTETGVDCGGSCSPCNTNNPNPSQQFQDIQGMWYYDYKVINITNSITGVLTKAQIMRDCKVELTDELVYAQNSSYRSIGQIAACSYPNQSVYTLETDYLMGMYINHADADSMHLQSGQDFIAYKRADLNNSSTEDIYWELELQSNYAHDGNLEILLNGLGITLDTVPIVSGQTFYSGTITVNLNANYPQLMLRVKTTAGFNATPEPITYTSKLYKNGVVISSHENATYCASNLAGSCQGYSSIFLNHVDNATITWY